MRRRSRLLLITAALLTPGCVVETVVDLASEPVVLDLGAEVAAFEAAVCQDAASRDCDVLRALDATDGALAQRPTLPARVPRMVDVPAREGFAALDAGAWLKQRGLPDRLTRPYTIDVGAEVASVQDLIDVAELHDLALVIGREDGADGDDAAELDALAAALPALALSLVDDAGVERRVALVPPSPSPDRPVYLVEGGADAILAALRGGALQAIIAPVLDDLAQGAGPIDVPRVRAAISLRASLLVGARADVLAVEAATR